MLWVTEEPPDHDGGGGSIRQAYLLDALATAFPLDLLVVGVLRDERVRSTAASVTELPTRRRLWSEHPVGRRALGLAIALGSRHSYHAYLSGPSRRALARAIRRRHTQHSLICVEHESLAPLLPKSTDETWIITLHALFSEIIRRDLALAESSRQRWFWRRDLRKARRLEQRAFDGYARCIVCSDDDAGALASVAGRDGAERITVIPNGVDLEGLHPTSVPARPGVLFPATLSYPPNVDGAVWFCAEIWPRIRAAVPDAALVLAGREPVAAVRALGRLDGVSIHADVPSMAPYFAAARVVVVPVRVGAGTRLKALEAMALARPVVGTTVGLEGLGIVDGAQALVADDPEAFASAVTKTLRNDELACSLAQQGRMHVERNFGWDRIGERFVATISELVGAG